MRGSNTLNEHTWTNQVEWNNFQLICSEDSQGESKEIFKYAQYGILCHKRSMNQELKNAIERLMRTDKPRIIIATMTLGQGVNLGILTVIFADTKFYDTEWREIDNKDFWNIAGRAGRSFRFSDNFCGWEKKANFGDGKVILIHRIIKPIECRYRRSCG